MGRNSCALIFVIGLVAMVDFMGADSGTVAVRSETASKDIQELWDELNYRGHKEPEQVYEGLKRIQQVYAAVNMSELSGYDQRAKDDYDILFQACIPTSDQCNKADSFRRKAFFENLKNDNIRNYLEHCEQKRIQLCEPILEEQLKAEVRKDDPEAKWRPQAKLLVDSIKSECAASGPYEKIRNKRVLRKVLAAGTLNYLETMEGPLNKSVLKLGGDSKDRFTGLFKRLVGDLCAILLANGKKQVKIFKVIREYSIYDKSKWEPTDFVKQWMDTEKVCTDIFSLDTDPNTFELLRKRNRGKGLLGSGRYV